MNKSYKSVQEMLDHIGPELAEEFRAYERRWSVRFRKWLSIRRLRLRLAVARITGRVR